MSTTQIIIAGGPIQEKSRAQIAALHKDNSVNNVVACDAGIITAYQLGITPQILVGDLDSTPSEILDWAKNNTQIKIHQFQADKDETDLELTLRLCDFNKYKFTNLFGCVGAREDFSLSNIHLIANYAYNNPTTQFTINAESGRFIFPHPMVTNQFMTTRGQNFSLIPLSDTVDSVCLRGAKWNLDNEKLLLGSGRGLSNQAIEHQIQLNFKQGLLAVYIFE
jgi:thiamine pyrophosphokinase